MSVTVLASAVPTIPSALETSVRLTVEEIHSLARTQTHLPVGRDTLRFSRISGEVSNLQPNYHIDVSLYGPGRRVWDGRITSQGRLASAYITVEGRPQIVVYGRN